MATPGCSFVEANLFIICGSLPTLRRFCRHTMPRLFCDSQSGGSANTGPASGNSGDLVRARRSRNQYEKFSDGTELYAMSGRTRNPNDRQMTVEVATGRASGDVDDDRSDKAIIDNPGSKIVQTKTVTVQYE